MGIPTTGDFGGSVVMEPSGGRVVDGMMVEIPTLGAALQVDRR